MKKNEEEGVIQTDVEKEGLKGVVKRIKQKHYKAFQKGDRYIWMVQKKKCTIGKTKLPSLMKKEEP